MSKNNNLNNDRAKELASLDFPSATDEEGRAAMREMLDCVEDSILISLIDFVEDGPGLCIMNQGASPALRMAAAKALAESVKEDLAKSPLGLLKMLAELTDNDNADTPVDFLKMLIDGLGFDRDDDDPFKLNHPHPD